MQEARELMIQTAEKHPRKGRSREEKIGRLKYNQQLLKQVLRQIEEIKESQRIILNGLKGAGYFHFEVPMIQKISCQDQVDLDILDAVYEAGIQGIFPKDVAKQLSQYDLKYYEISRRILRMNKRLRCEIGERLFEKRGWKWALTRFAFDVWGEGSEETSRM
jgi:hypothetical protein